MSHPPPGLGGGSARAGPPPGFGASAHTGGGGGGGGRGGTQSTDAISRAQIVFLLTTFTEDTFDKVSQEIRSLASSNGPETYHHYVRRTTIVAAPVISALLQHSQQYKDDLAAPPPQIPTVGPAALAWRLLLTEAVRAARDASLAPHFVNTILTAAPSTPLPFPHFRPFGLPAPILFCMCAFALAAPNIFPASHPAHDMVLHTLQSTFGPTMEALVSGAPFWAAPHVAPDDLSLQEARALILAIYPHAGASDASNPTAPHPALLDSHKREYLLAALGSKFRSPAIVLQTLSALSPGGAPRTPDAIPLEDFLFELGNRLTTHDTVEAAVVRWWGPYILGDAAALQAETARFIAGLLNGIVNEGRMINAQGVFEGLSAAAPIPFASVVKTFDIPQSPLANLPVSQALAVLLALLTVPPQNPVPPIAGLLPASPSEPVWTNLKPLLYILTNLVSLPEPLPLFFLPTSPAPASFARVVEPIGADAPASKAVRQKANESQAAGLWNALGLYQVIVTACALAEADNGVSKLERAEIGRVAVEILERASQVVPDLVLIALEKLPKPLPPAAANKHMQLLRAYLANPPSVGPSQLISHHLYQVRKEGFVDMLLELYQEDENHIGRIVDIAGELRILDKLLSSENFHFALDFASVASNNQMLSLEKWLADGVAVRGDHFLQAVFDFVEHKVAIETEHQHMGVPIPSPLGESVYSIFIRVIRNAEDLSQEDIARFKNLRTDILILHPRLLNFRPGSQEQGFAVAQFPKDVETQVDEMYQHMYDEEHQVSLDDVVDELKRCQQSSDAHDMDIFACALHSLFDEIRFIKTYPHRELIMTGILFGAIIDARLVKDVPAFVATRYVLDAVKAPEPTYSFGIAALSVLRPSLVDFPGLCRSLLEVLHDSPLVADISAALAEREELAQQGGVKLAFPALRLPVLIEEGDDEFREPEPKLRDGIMFIINNLAPSNFETKSADLVRMFDSEHSRWFAHYLIDVRVATELNRHDEYYKLIELIDSPVLERHILWETLRKARDLLNADTALTRANERQTLKTIAIWLGRITLARNLPLKHRELSIKDLLVQGHDNKRLIVAIPFVCNIMAACKQSDVFRMPNPWLHAMLRVLSELYNFGELRLNLKFEIEVLFQELGTQVALIEPSTIIRDHAVPPSPQAPLPNRLDLELQRALNTGAAPAVELAASHEQYGRHVDELISQLPERLVFNSDYGVIQAPTFKRMVHVAIDHAIKEIIQPVVERSVTIAGISTRDLVQKDYGSEPDVNKMRHAAHLMVQNLAGNLALATCREPLRGSLMQHLRALVSQNGFTEENVPDAVLAGVVNENLDVSADVIKKAAMERATNDIDVNLQQQFAARRAYRDSRQQQPFWDANALSTALQHNALPDPLRIRPNGLTGKQMRVYEDFAERPPPPPPPPAAAAVAAEGMDEIKRGPSPRYPPEMAASPLPPQASLERFHELVAEVEKHLAHVPTATLQALPPDHELRSLLRAILLVAHSALNRDTTTLVMAQKIVQLLFKSTTPLGRELYVALLQQLCIMVPKVDREVKSWLIYAEDPRKFNVPVTVSLLQSGLIRAVELDPQFAKLVVRGFAPQILDFAAQLIRECTAFVPRNGFAATVATLLKAQEAGQSSPAVDELLEDLRRESAEAPPVDGKLKERLAHYFLEWVRVYSNSKNLDVAFVPYITFLQKEGILNGEDVSSAFYRTAISSAVDYDTSKLMIDGPVRWYGTDALANLIVLMVKNYDAKSGTNVSRPVYYFNKIITIISYTLVQRHVEMGETFDQRPWARFFTSVLAELQTLEQGMPETYLGCLKSLANVLGITQPTYAPRFAFGWLSVVSHRNFMAKLLQAPREHGWADYHRCLLWLLRFLSPFLKSDDELAPSSRSYYRGTLRLLLVLLHDFQEFLVEFYHTLSTAIPAHCVQLRNIVLAAFPESEAPLPDVYRRLDLLVGDMQNVPTVRSDFVGALASGNVKAAIDQYVRTGQPAGAAIVAELKNRVAVKTMAPDGTTSVVYNHTLLHATVFYLGTTAVQRHKRERGMAEFDAEAPEVGILASLAFALEPEGQYYMLSVIADQLRYPSAHTLFFIYLMLYLFTAGVQADVDLPERVSRVLLERVIVQRPHPWGLLVAFIELLENAQYGFWQQPFVRAESEIHMLFVKARPGP